MNAHEQESRRAGRPALSDSPLVPANLMVTSDQKVKLHRIARGRNVSASHIVRQLIDQLKDPT